MPDIRWHRRFARHGNPGWSKQPITGTPTDREDVNNLTGAPALDKGNGLGDGRIKLADRHDWADPGPGQDIGQRPGNKIKSLTGDGVGRRGPPDSANNVGKVKEIIKQALCGERLLDAPLLRHPSAVVREVGVQTLECCQMAPRCFAGVLEGCLEASDLGVTPITTRTRRNPANDERNQVLSRPRWRHRLSAGWQKRQRSAATAQGLIGTGNPPVFPAPVDDLISGGLMRLPAPAAIR